MSTTKGEWKVSEVQSDESMCPVSYFEIGREGDPFWIAHVRVGSTPLEGFAHANLIALAGNLNQKYDLSKLEALVDAAGTVEFHNRGGFAVVELQAALRAITRQPAGEKPQQ